MSHLKRTAAVAAVIALVLPGIATAEPLAPGKPAGVKQADLETVSPFVWVALAGVAAAAIAAAATSDNSPSASTTTSATTT